MYLYNCTYNLFINLLENIVMIKQNKLSKTILCNNYMGARYNYNYYT